MTSSCHVIVLGAGLAGLSAAHRLVEAGCRVTVIEVQERAGGRALTHDHVFAEGLIAECGPARFPADFFRVVALAKRFGLILEPFYPQTGKIVGYQKGERVVGFVPDDEQFWGYHCRNRGLRAWLWSVRGRLPQKMYHLQGGTHQLPAFLASSLDAELFLGCEVVSVEQDREGVRVKYRSPRVAKEFHADKELYGDKELHADKVVCALPLSALPKLRFVPPLPEPKARSIARIPSMPAVRVFFQMSRPFWLEDGLNGFAFTDTIGEVWAPQFAAPRSPCLLVCYAQRDLAERLCALGAAERMETVRRELEKVFPGARRHVQDAATFSWRDPSWIDGAWPMVRAGFRDTIPLLQEPHGRIHFAGDYAATPRYLNMMEGALESGERAAGRILDMDLLSFGLESRTR